MSVIDLITLVDAICKKCDKNDVNKQKEVNISGNNAFARLYAVVNGALDEVLQKLEAASVAKNRATAVAMNAEIRRSKACLLDKVPKLQ